MVASAADFVRCVAGAIGVSDKNLHSSVAPGAAHAGGEKLRRLSAGVAERLAELQLSLQRAREVGASTASVKLSLLMLLVGLACLVVAFALLPGPLTALQVFVALGVGFTLISLYLAFTAAARPGADQLEHVGARIERRLERLQDVQWELSENESRYRALLDTQEDAIVRRDELGNLTFANKAFLDMFAVSADEVLGKPFVVEVCEESGIEPLSVADDVRHQRFVQHAFTASGPRWIEWEEHLVAAASGGHFEVQSVGRDVTEQRRAETQLAEARDQAEAANRAKGRFLAAMSHEIRTPMNGILGMASLLLETPQTPEQQTYARAIDQSARTLLALIDEILDFSKIEAGKLELSEAPFALETCIQGAVELLAPRAHEKGLEIAWSMSSRLPRVVLGDEARVRQILLNLLSNAVKFTDTGGVSVKVTEAEAPTAGGGTKIAIVVEDTGIGLTPEDMRGLFTEFEQAETAIRRRNGGTGLGLAISMQLARAMGGEIRVDSEPGKGSRFTADIVLQPVALADSSEPAILSDSGRVLLAFDRSLERRALSEALSSAGIAALETSFAAAATALESASSEGAPIDRLVVDGAEGPAAAGGLLAKARQLNRQANVRGIVLVNVLARASLSEFRAAGFDAYLVRPVRPASMLMQLGLRGSESPSAVERPDALGSPPQPALGGISPRRVLLAEDNEINSLLAKRVLEKCGCDYVAVTNGADAVAVVRRALEGEVCGVDLVLMDIFMPQLDGIEAARAIKELYARAPRCIAAPPIVALTANAFAEDRQRYLDAGMDDYLAKPFDKASLETVLMRWFGRRPGGDADAAA
ncbi:MAG: response regulator [Hyphomicrobium sp.]|nr:MAG: response regulator [Hyphomicrobium sp.]